MSGFPEIKYRYWPAIGRGIGVRVLLEGAGVQYERQNHDGQMPDPACFAVPAVSIGGEWISQTSNIMESLGVALNMGVPDSANARARMTLLTCYDLQCEVFSHVTGNSGRSWAEAKGFLEGRAFKYLDVIEKQFGLFPGLLFMGDAESYPDYALLGAYMAVSLWMGEKGANHMKEYMMASCPNLTSVLNKLLEKPKLKAFEAEHAGEALGPQNAGKPWNE